MLKPRIGWLPSVFLFLACDHALVVGEHGDEDAIARDAAREGAGGAPQRDAAPDVALDTSADHADAPYDTSVDVTTATDASDAPSDAPDAAKETGGDADAAFGDAPIDRAIVPGCLPDGNAGMTFKSTGGLDLDIMRGNEITCSSSVAGTQVSMTDKAGNILSGHAAIETDLVFDDLARGRTGNVPVLVKITLIAGALPPVWTSMQAQCSVDVVTNAFVATTDGGALYEVGGAVTCNGALAPAPDNSSAALTISTFSFVTAVTYP